MYQYILLSVGLVLMALAALLGLPEGKPYYRLGLLIAGALFSISGQVVSYFHSHALKAKIREIQPRSLTGAQKSTLIKLISQHEGRIGFISRFMDGESREYADQLEAAFKEAGWQIGRANQSFLGDLKGYMTMGTTGDNLEATARIIQEALKSIGIELRNDVIRKGSYSGTLEENYVYIFVGRK